MSQLSAICFGLFLLASVSTVSGQGLNPAEDRASIEAVLREAHRIGREQGRIASRDKVMILIQTGDSARDAALHEDSASVAREFGDGAGLTRALDSRSLCPSERATRMPSGCPGHSLDPSILVFRHSMNRKYLGYVVTFAGPNGEPQSWRIVLARGRDAVPRVHTVDVLVH